MIDILDQEIKVGDIVAHGQRSSTTAYLSLKLVQALRTKKVNTWTNITQEVEEVKVIGYELKTRKYNETTEEWEDVTPYYKLNSRGGWTTPDVLLVVTDAAPKDVKQFLRESQ